MLDTSGRLIGSVAFLAVLVCATGWGTSRQSAKPGPRQSILLLRNGEAIKGKITRAGDLYYVALPDGELRIRTADVELWCNNFQEGYRWKRAVIQIGDVHDHLRLTRWCLRHELYGRAAEELADALDADPRHPMIGLLQRRLKMAVEPPQKHATRQTSDPRPLSVDDLDRLVRGMPRGTVETFTQTIQPLLMNNCTAAGCHGPQSPTEFRLFRVPSGRPASRRLTQRNLHATLQWIDRRKPTASRLLTEPVGAHGNAKTPIFNKHQDALYRRLVDWVCRVAEQQEPKGPATVDGRKHNGDGSAIHREAPPRVLSQDASGARPLPPASPTQGEATPTTHQEPAAESDRHDPAGRDSKIKRGARLRQFVPADPFDPEIFNRRFFGN